MGTQPLSAAEQTVPLEQNDLIAFDEEALKIIYEANKGQAVQQLGIVENPRESWLWDFDLTEPNQGNLDTSVFSKPRWTTRRSSVPELPG